MDAQGGRQRLPQLRCHDGDLHGRRQALGLHDAQLEGVFQIGQYSGGPVRCEKRESRTHWDGANRAVHG